MTREITSNERRRRDYENLPEDRELEETRYGNFIKPAARKECAGWIGYWCREVEIKTIDL